MTMKAVPFDSAAHDHFNRIEPEFAEWVELEEVSGRLTVLGCYADDRRIASVAIRVDGDALEIAGAGGERIGVNLYQTILPAIEQIARDSGLKRVTAWTKKAGIVRKLLGVGFGVEYTAFSKAI